MIAKNETLRLTTLDRPPRDSHDERQRRRWLRAEKLRGRSLIDHIKGCFYNNSQRARLLLPHCHRARTYINARRALTYTRGSLASQLAAMSNYVALILSLATPVLAVVAGAASTSQQKALPIDARRRSQTRAAVSPVPLSQPSSQLECRGFWSFGLFAFPDRTPVSRLSALEFAN